MSTGRRIGIVAATAAVAMGMLTVTAPAASAATGPQQAQDLPTAQAKKKVKGPRPVSRTLKAVDAGESAWVQVKWKTDVKICDAQVTVRDNRHIEVDYPGEREFTSFSRGDSLKRGRTDFTAFRVEADYDRDSWALITATISYTDCEDDSPTYTRSTDLMLPVRA
ncbi:hypothetical protein Aab01nite_72310 [Paractinoplanes abujensis]|uniref:Uncharacterized protein n=1 Tax=Paractinoplanes abujensis TaxID=882441 RepID=A0A7W7G3J4_9ACTN|nr:hypothetical protein [Actinoplanes abujensis]MBB4694912.1 hypothetical protein [Actinoplanes abujensis]GID23641.1 hypothetical protein Aab01nite_72310 [Actinoplanes abujensis]